MASQFKQQNHVLNHVAVCVPSASDAVAWYAEQFGFELIGNAIFHTKRSSDPTSAIFRIYPQSLTEVKIAYMATGNGVGFEVFEFPQEQAADNPPRGNLTATGGFEYSRGGFFHVCVTNPEPQLLAERVVAAGGKLIGEAVKLGDDGAVDCLYVADPWGNVVEVLSTSFERLASRLMDPANYFAIKRLAARITAFDNTLPQATPLYADSKFHQQSDFGVMGYSSVSDPAVCTAKFELNNGMKIPAVGLGTWQGQYGTNAAAHLHSSILHALHAGYRLIDTAQYYGVENIVGAAVRESGVPRSEITVITKFWGEWHHDPAAALQNSLRDLDIDYVDIMLMHWPCAMTADGKHPLGIDESPTFVETWKKMEPLIGNRCRAIGVSNFTQKTLAVLLRECEIVPVVNQVELHAFNPGLALVPWCEQHGIKVLSWSTMGGGADYTESAAEILTHSTFTDIAAAHNCPVGAVSLSWAVQRGIIIIPKSSSTSRIDFNIRLVTLTDKEMDILNRAHRTIRRLRLADHIPGMKYEYEGRPTIMGWTAEDFGWEDSQGNWLT